MASRIILFLFFCFVQLFSSSIEVSALNFYSDENSGKNILSGDVVVKKDKDVLSAQKIIIFTDKNKKPIKYEASQNPKFSIYLKDKLYKGSGDLFIYNVKSDVYEIIGNAHINEVTTNKKLYGDKIIVDRKNNIYQVKSKNNKPTRFTFELNDK